VILISILVSIHKERLKTFHLIPNTPKVGPGVVKKTRLYASVISVPVQWLFQKRKVTCVVICFPTIPNTSIFGQVITKKINFEISVTSLPLTLNSNYSKTVKDKPIKLYILLYRSMHLKGT
jgi:hypothetical protein